MIILSVFSSMLVVSVYACRIRLLDRQVYSGCLVSSLATEHYFDGRVRLKISHGMLM